MQLKTIKTMAIQYTDCFMTPFKGGIIVLEKLMFIGLQKSHQLLLINALLKACHLAESMVGFWTTGLLEEF